MFELYEQTTLSALRMTEKSLLLENVRHEASLLYDAENSSVVCHKLPAKHEQTAIQL